MAKKVKIKSLLKNKILIALVVLGVAAGGAYVIINSRAATPPPTGELGVTAYDSTTNTVLPNATITTNPNNSSYSCSSYPNANNSTYKKDSGQTDNAGYVRFSCLTFLGTTGKQYVVSISKAGYISNGNVTITIQKDSGTGITISARQADSDGDGVTDIRDSCPTQGNAGYGVAGNGCPNPAPPAPAPTPAPLPAISAGPSVSSRCSNGNIVIDASWGSYSRTANYNLDARPATSGTWSGGWFRSIGAAKSVSGINSFNPWGGKSGTLVIAPNTRYDFRVAYLNTAEHSPNATITTTSCPKSVVSTPTPKPAPPKAKGGASKVVARAPAATPAPTNPSDTTKPTAPANLTAEQIGNGEVDLSWDESTDEAGIDSYTVERSEDGVDWTILDDAVLINSYSDTTADFGVSYSYRVSAKDNSGNYSDYAVVDIETNAFSANIFNDEDSTVSSDDGIVTVRFPSGSLGEDAYCEITKDTIRSNPKGYKLAAGGYIIECKNADGDSITDLEKAAQVTMDLKSFKYKSYAAYSIDSDGNFETIQSAFNSKTGELSFEINDLSNAFAAYGKSGGSTWWIWLIIILILILLIIAFIRWRRSRAESAEDAYYDSAGYVTMPPSAPVGPTDAFGSGGGGGYEQHTSLPDMVAQGQQPQQPYQEFPPTPPMQGQPGEYPGPDQDPNQFPPQPGPGQQPNA